MDLPIQDLGLRAFEVRRDEGRPTSSLRPMDDIPVQDTVGWNSPTYHFEAPKVVLKVPQNLVNTGIEWV